MIRMHASSARTVLMGSSTPTHFKVVASGNGSGRRGGTLVETAIRGGVSMLAVELLVALAYSSIAAGIILALALAAALLVPYLVQEIRKGKVSLGPRLPAGTGEPHPGRRGDPAPGHPEAQADPYDPKASR